MILLGCPHCSATKEAGIADDWSVCYECGGGPLLVKRCPPSELVDGLSFLRRLPAPAPTGGVLLLLDKLLQRRDASCEPLLDAAILLFGDVVVPDTTWDDVGKMMPAYKVDCLRRAGALRNVDLAGFNLRRLGLKGLVAGERLKMFDHSLHGSIKVDSWAGSEDAMKVIDGVDNAIENLASRLCAELLGAYPSELQAPTFDTRLEKYNSVLLRAKHILRSEVASRLMGQSLMVDAYYGSIFGRRSELWSGSHPSSGGLELGLISEWMRTSRLHFRPIAPDDLLEFRERGLSLQPLVEEVKSYISKSSTPLDLHDFQRSFGDRMDKILDWTRKRSERTGWQSAILSGLISTAGSLVGGVQGALLGGIGGSMITQALNERGRVDPPELAFLLQISEDRF